MVPQAEVKKQPEPLYYPLRFRLRKDGALRYISHLDFVRTMTKVLMRSGLPLWFTLGFNPIPKITFAAPLSVFMDSDCELMDVRMNTPVSPEEAKERLSAVLPPDMEVLESAYNKTNVIRFHNITTFLNYYMVYFSYVKYYITIGCNFQF